MPSVLSQISRRQLLASALPASIVLTVPARAAAQALPFVVIGDWGRRGADHQAEVARRMGETASAIGSRFVISVGDNFYEDGVQSLEDAHWRQSFEEIYTAPALQTPWHVILGNHDYRGEIAPQLAYHTKSPRWLMPARYFSRRETLADGSAADFFFLDTSPFIRAYRGTAVRIDGQDTAAQLAWLDRALGRSEARWKIVIGHHPLYTALGGAHHDQPDLIAPLAPLLRRHRVPVYINGHDHSMQYVEMDGIAYVTTGAGSETYATGPANRPGFVSGAHGFLRAALRPETLEIAFVTESGVIPFSRVITRAA
jgi:acid phosphatase